MDIYQFFSLSSIPDKETNLIAFPKHNILHSCLVEHQYNVQIIWQLFLPYPLPLTEERYQSLLLTVINTRDINLLWSDH